MKAISQGMTMPIMRGMSAIVCAAADGEHKMLIIM